MADATVTQRPFLTAINADLPTICGWESDLQAITNSSDRIYPSTGDRDRLRAGFACALHMHQPTVPAGANGALICNLQHMFEHAGEGDNHNAGVLAWCYSRMGDFIPELVANGASPRIMLDYSGNLL